MSVEKRKYKIIQQIMEFNEEQLEKLESYLIEEPELLISLEKSLKQIKQGKVTPHEEVKKKYAKWL